MFEENDTTLKAKVSREVGRLNGELCDLKELEETLKIRKARLEVEMRQALAARDLFELLGRLGLQFPLDNPVVARALAPVTVATPIGGALGINGMPALEVLPAPTTPKTNEMNGTHVPAEVLVKSASGKLKPDGLPTVSAMVLGAIEDAVQRTGKGLSSRDIIAFVRGKWWPDAPATRVYAIVSQLARSGRIEKKRGRYTAVMPRLVMPADEVTASAQ